MAGGPYFFLPSLCFAEMSDTMLKMIAQMKALVLQMEASVKATQTVTSAAAVVKPKRQLSEGMKEWHAFNARIDTLLKAHDVKFHRVAEAKQFASMIHKKMKETAAAPPSDEEILAARQRWAEEHKPSCAICHASVGLDDVSAHTNCAASFISGFVGDGKRTKEEGMAAWMKA